MRFADLKNDFVFRRIFAHHPALTTALLNDLLDRRDDDRIDELTVLPPEQAPEIPGAKLSILDLRCRDQTGRWFVVEMQLLHVAGFLNRVAFNACKAYVGQLGAGQSYRELADVVAVSVCDFVIWPDTPRAAAGLPLVPLVSRWAMQETASGARDLGQVQYAFVELPKVPATGPLVSAAAKWAWLFRFGASLEAVPPGLSEAQAEALGLANEALFSGPEREAYRRVHDEIEQARQLALDAETRGRQAGWSAGQEAGLREGHDAGLREAIADLCEAFGIELTAARQSALASHNGTELEALRAAIKRDKRWPDAS